MYEQMYKLDEVLEFFKNELGAENDERITELYNMISNPHLRVNDNDKQWVAYVTQDSENKTVEDAMKAILDVNAIDWILTEEKKVKEAIKTTGNLFINNGIKNKPRIPFYIMVLDELVD